jgi:hypothetical protein
MMKKFLILLVMAMAAILCIGIALQSKPWTRFDWPINAFAMVLMWTSGTLGVALILLLMFLILRFLIRSAIPSVENVSFLSVFLIGIIVIILMCLYPPWIKFEQLPDGSIIHTNPQGYALLWHSMGRHPHYEDTAIDISRLRIQILVVVFITCGLLFSLWICQSKRKSSE